MNPRSHIRMWIGAWELVGEVGRASMRTYTRIYMQLMSLAKTTILSEIDRA
jgi:hypothetical protein